MSDTFLPGSGFDTYESQDKVLVQMDGSRECAVAVRILQQQGFAVAGAAVRRYRFNGKVYEKELSGGDDSTTNNRMELTAFIEALRQLKEPCEVRLCSDSQYVINGLEKGWARGWKRRGWKKSDGSPALNPDLWEQALEQEARHKITYVWVKGHAGHPENERCDQLAVAQSQAHGGRQGR